jgi:outer membrane protein assembly factor BamB
MKEDVRQIAGSQGPRVVVGAYKISVEVWDVGAAKRLSAFSTPLDSGGTRLCLDAKGERCFVGGYKAGVVEAYDAETGRTLWTQSGFKEIQHLSRSAGGDRVYVGTERGPARALDAKTGKTIETLKGVKRVFEGGAGVRFLDRQRPVVERPTGASFTIDHESFAILDVAIGSSALCLSESGGPVRCLDLDGGAELWRYEPPKNEHLIAVSYCSSIDAFVGVSLEYEETSNQTLVRLGPQGKAKTLASLGNEVEAGFCLGGEALLLSDGRLLAAPTGKSIRTVPMEE